ncbi:hypothetical protein VPH35_126905 [Triticum aestivum]
MRRLEKLVLGKCRLRHVPPGLASNARSLKILCLQDVEHLSYIESFPSVVELTVNDCPNLERITNLPNMQKLAIRNCPNFKLLERITSFERLVLEDYTMEKLPEYTRDIKLRHLQLFCRLWLLCAVAAGQSGTEHMHVMETTQENGTFCTREETTASWIQILADLPYLKKPYHLLWWAHKDLNLCTK